MADELASVSELVSGKLGGRPVVVVRGLATLVLAPGEHGPGSRALLRPRAEDMFALGAREAVVAAVLGTDSDCFGAPAAPEAVVTALRACGVEASTADSPTGPTIRVRLPGAHDERVVAGERVRLLAHAHGWQSQVTDGDAHPDHGSDRDHLLLSPAAP